MACIRQFTRREPLQLILSVISIIVLGTLVGCSETKVSSTGQNTPDHQGSFIGHSDCLEIPSPDKSLQEEMQACIEYSYDGSATLHFTNLDVMYNCCLDSITCQISHACREVTVYEYPFLMGVTGCDCICPYNLDYQIDMVPAGEFTITLYMDYPYYIQMPAVFTLLLPHRPIIDTLCVDLEFDFDL